MSSNTNNSNENGEDVKRLKQTSDSAVPSSLKVIAVGKMVQLASHPVVQHKLTQLRRAETSTKHFRELVSEITLYLGFEATRDLEVEELVVSTPMCKATGYSLASKVAFVPIMRGGLGLVESMLTIVPMAQVHHIGMYNNPESLLPVLYYNKLPRECSSEYVIVLDIIVGSGATLIATVDLVKEWCQSNPKTKIKVVTIILSRLGLNKFSSAHPDVPIHAAALDDGFESGTPVPGIGDAGVRMFNAD